MSASTRPRYAVVVHLYGEGRFGGASTLAAAIGRCLSDVAEVDVLTTCAQNYMTWQNVYAPGHSRVDGVHVRRFPVDRRRNVGTFNRLSRQLLETPDPSEDLQEAWMRAQGPLSSQLLEYLETFGKRYDAVLFFSYLYADTYFGLPLVEDRAFLFPLAHDEWPLRLSIWERFFGRPRGFFFNSPEEREFLRSRFPKLELEGPIAGLGIDVPAKIEPNRFREQVNVREPFLLYVGRVDPSKGCDNLIDDFTRYRAGGGHYRDLVLIGDIHMPVRPAAGVHVIGPVDEQTKWNAIAASDVLVMPSRYESLSIAVLEAWALEKPVLVNALSPALVGQCRRARAGLWYANSDEFSVTLDIFDKPLAQRLGAEGRAFVTENYTWPRVMSVLQSRLSGALA